ncbi:hypothetical protein IWX90DRAFT_410409 [Phyllosticta citrichinensis]|uniref:Uncharacterized protein n=1 Tax=Phyllosticta citrichinensis TaxID=1130410 RepID=A0ABR1Y4X8_9PEZI
MNTSTGSLSPGEKVVVVPRTEDGNEDESMAPCLLVAASRPLKLLKEITPGLGPVLQAGQWNQMFKAAWECDVKGSGAREGMGPAPTKATCAALGKRCRENDREETQRKRARKDATAAEVSTSAGPDNIDGVETGRQKVEIISLSDNSDDSNESSRSSSPYKRAPFRVQSGPSATRPAEDLDDEAQKEEGLLTKLQAVSPDIEWIRKSETETRLRGRGGAVSRGKRTTKKNAQGMIMMEAETGKVLLRKAEEF